MRNKDGQGPVDQGNSTKRVILLGQITAETVTSTGANDQGNTTTHFNPKLNLIKFYPNWSYTSYFSGSLLPSVYINVMTGL
jgi:hypothetical protein